MGLLTCLANKTTWRNCTAQLEASSTWRTIHSWSCSVKTRKKSTPIQGVGKLASLRHWAMHAVSVGNIDNCHKAYRCNHPNLAWPNNWTWFPAEKLSAEIHPRFVAGAKSAKFQGCGC
eukprot:1394669-Amphidinium_carterae.1